MAWIRTLLRRAVIAWGRSPLEHSRFEWTTHPDDCVDPRRRHECARLRGRRNVAGRRSYVEEQTDGVDGDAQAGGDEGLWEGCYRWRVWGVNVERRGEFARLAGVVRLAFRGGSTTLTWFCFSLSLVVSVRFIPMFHLTARKNRSLTHEHWPTLLISSTTLCGMKLKYELYSELFYTAETDSDTISEPYALMKGWRGPFPIF